MGCRAPRSEAPLAVVTMTRCETMFAGSWPPRGWSRMKPLSSMCLTRKPISSMCAATITRTSSRPRFVPMTLPRASVWTSSVRSSSSSRAISRCLSSRPGTPGVSLSRLNNASLSATYSPSFREVPREPNNGATARQSAGQDLAGDQGNGAGRLPGPVVPQTEPEERIVGRDESRTADSGFQEISYEAARATP